MEIQSISFHNSILFQRGRSGEKIVAEELQKRGWYVIPSYDYSGGDEHAPKLWGAQRNYVIPDLDVSVDGTRMWIEVKTKSKFTWTRMTKQLEHGIPRRHFEHYLEVQRITGTPVYLFIYELNTQMILRQSIDKLNEHKRYSNMGGRLHVFFPRGLFEPFITLKAEAVQ